MSAWVKECVAARRTLPAPPWRRFIDGNGAGRLIGPPKVPKVRRGVAAANETRVEIWRGYWGIDLLINSRKRLPVYSVSSRRLWQGTPRLNKTTDPYCTLRHSRSAPPEEPTASPRSVSASRRSPTTPRQPSLQDAVIAAHDALHVPPQADRRILGLYLHSRGATYAILTSDAQPTKLGVLSQQQSSTALDRAEEIGAQLLRVRDEQQVMATGEAQILWDVGVLEVPHTTKRHSYQKNDTIQIAHEIAGIVKSTCRRLFKYQPTKMTQQRIHTFTSFSVKLQFQKKDYKIP
eukprot:GHVT01018760.1.p1 GENE.GHVT01018760.1~~GHVT01018760.1.p1  ORF type:complete len:291 (+),score=16.08 GHVT01018760.1:2755-3627(+)